MFIASLAFSYKCYEKLVSLRAIRIDKLYTICISSKLSILSCPDVGKTYVSNGKQTQNHSLLRNKAEKLKVVRKDKKKNIHVDVAKFDTVLTTTLRINNQHPSAIAHVIHPFQNKHQQQKFNGRRSAIPSKKTVFHALGERHARQK